MKKLIVLLLAFAMVGGVFAQTPALSASATLSFGVDLDTMQFGFKNDYSAKVTVPFAVANASKKGDSGWWGEIAVSNITFKLSDNPVAGGSALTFTDTDADGNPASLTAKITNGTWALSVYSAASPKFDVALDLTDTAYASAVFGKIDALGFGTKLSYAKGAYSAGIIASSKGDWTTNTSNEFALGTYADYKFTDTVSGGVKVAYDAFQTTKDLTAAAKISASFGKLSTFLGADVKLDAFAFDVRGDVKYAMDDLTAALNVYYGASDIDARAKVDYAKDAIEAGVALTDSDILAGGTYDFAAYAGYTLKADAKTSVYFRVDYTDDFAGARTLTPYVKLTNTSIANTTLTATWCSPTDTTVGVDLLAGKVGALVFAAKVSL